MPAPTGSTPNLNRLVNRLIDDRFPYLRDEHIHALHAPFELMRSPFAMYHELGDDLEFEYILAVDTDLVSSRALMRGGLTHELAHVALDVGRSLDVLSSIDNAYDSDPHVHYQEEILANALCIEAGAGSELRRVAHWSYDRFGTSEPLEHVRAAERWLR